MVFGLILIGCGYVATLVWQFVGSLQDSPQLPSEMIPRLRVVTEFRKYAGER